MSILETLTNPSMLHAALVHLPIALSILGVPLVLMSAFFHRNTTLRLIAVGVYAMMAVTALIAEEAGEKASAKIPPDVSTEIAHVVSDHEDLAERIKAVAAITAVLLLFCFINQEAFRKTVMLFACCGSLVAAMLAALAAHQGGELVYKHGVGTGLMAEHVARQPKVAAGETGAEDWLPIREIDLDEARAVSYTRDIKPIFEARCVTCHESPDPDGAYDMTTVAKMLLAGEKSGPGIIPGKPDESPLVEYIRGIKQPRMPKKKAPLSGEELHGIRLWIAAGATDDSGTLVEAPPEAVPAVETPAEEDAPVEEAPFDPFG